VDTAYVTLRLPKHLYAELQSLAANEQESLADVIARLITIAREQPPPPETEQEASTPAFQHILEHATDLGVTDLAEQHDHYLYGVEKD
jgi:hypothetical protein